MLRCFCLLIMFASPLAAQAEMDVQRLGDPVADGGTDSVTNSGTSPFNLTYTIQNDGTTALNLTGTPAIAISNENKCSVSILGNPSTPVAPAGSTTFILQVTPNSSAGYSFDVSIDNDDANENPYDFTFSATTTSPPVSGDSNGNGDDESCSTAAGKSMGLLTALVFLWITTFMRSKSLRRMHLVD